MATKKKRYDNEELNNILDGNYSGQVFKPVDYSLLNNPVQPSNNNKDKGFFDNWFKAGAFDDGYQFGDVSKTLLGTTEELFNNLETGAISTVEGILDAGANLVSGAFDEQTAKKIREWAQKDFLADSPIRNFTSANPLSGIAKINDAILNGNIGTLNPFDSKAQDEYRERIKEYSVSGDKLDNLEQGVGQLAGQVALNSVGVPWQLTAFASSMGQEMNNAFQNNANYGQALLSGIISGGAEVGSEYIGGGANKLLGMTSLGSKAIEKLGSKIGNKVVQLLVKRGLDMAGEGAEEVVSGYLTAIGQKLTYMNDKEINEIYSTDQALEEFINGALISGIANVGGDVMKASTTKGRKRLLNENAFTGMTDNEQKVYDRLINDETKKALEKNDGKKLTKKQINQIKENVREEMSKGRVNVDYIEDTLGFGDRVNYLVNEAENSLARELNEEERRDIENQAREEILDTMGNDYVLQESYLQDQLRRNKFEMDISKVDEKLQDFYQKAIDSGMLNNTRDTHNFVDMLAKIHKDKGIDFDFTNNEKLAESGFSLDGKTINGYITDNGIALNLNSKNALESTVGHEITHVIEGTDMYDALAKSIKEYAESKGEYAKRLKEVQDLYKDVENADATKELTADLVGDYLFTNQEFINHLTQNRNLFQKIYDEIKYLVKQVTAGSKEERKLNKAMKMFEKAYKDNSVKLAEQETSTQPKFSITQDDNGNKYVKVDTDQNIFEGINKKDYNKIARMYITDYLLGNTILSSNDYATIDSTGRNKYTNPGNNQKYFDKKMQLTPELKNVMKIAEKVGQEGKNKPNATYDNYEYYKFNFELNDNMFEGLLNIGIDKDGKKHFYEINNIKKVEGISSVSTNSPSTNTGNISQNNDNVKLSLTQDANGNKLSKEQQNYFKDSKIRDTEGKLIPMYHGTPNGEFTVFRPGSYFSSNKQYADGYQNTWASSISSGKVETNPKTYEVYLNITNPFSIQNEDAKNIYLNEYIKGGNSAYYDPYTDYTSTINNMDEIDWTEGEDLATWLQENHPEYDGLVLDEGGDGGYGEAEYRWRGKSYMPFSSNQVKNTDNTKPTTNDDIRYSLSTDSNGRELTEQQQEYFKDSKVRDNEGRLLEVYHGTNNEFNTYKSDYNEYYFTDNEKAANDYGYNIKKEYLNLTNPYIVDFEGKNDKANDVYENGIFDVIDFAKENGYDGVIAKNTFDGANTHNQYVAFEPNQIKNIDNLNPTSNPDIRYSLTQKVDAELDDLTNEQYEYFKNTKAVNQNGELEVVYHGTPHEFSVFDIEKAGETGLAFGNGFYFTNSKGSAMGYTDGGVYGDNYDQVKEGYVNIEKPASRDTKTMTYNEFYNLYNALNENPNMYDDEMGMSNIDALLSDYGDIYNDKENTIKKFYDSYDDDVSLIDNLSYIGNPTEMYKTLRDVTGYDGIIPENPVSYDSFEKFYIAFNPDQFKLKSNKTPTDNVDMNLSLSKIDDVAPIRKPGLTYGEDIAYQEDIAPIGIDYSIDRDIMDLFHQEIARKNGKKVQLTKPVIAKEKSSIRSGLDTLSTMFVNQNTEIDNLAKESGNKNIKFAGDMLNNYSAEAQNDITVAQTDNYGNAIGKSVQQLFEPAKAKGLEAAFNDYLINYSNIDRWARGKGSQTPVDVSERLVKNYEEQHPEFKRWAKDIWKFGENVRKNWLDAGMIKQSMYNLLSEAYPHYVPYISDTNNFDAAIDKLNELKARPIKRAVGGATELFPVEEALTRYTFAQKRAYRQNELFKQIYNTLQTNPGQRGADVGEGYFTGEEPNLYRDDSGNYITALFDGEEHKIQVSDDLFKSLRNDMQTQIKDLENKLSIITKPLQTASNIRRKMLTSWSPSFTITNPLKDIQDAFFNSKHLKEMAKNYIPGIKELWTGSTPEARQFLALYGEGNLMGQFENESGLYDAKKGNKNNKFLKGLSKVNNIMELAPRYAEFKASLQAGESLAESMYNAREITTNFSRGGVITKALNRNGFTFLNASVQGFDKFIRNFSGENGARGIASSLLRAVMLGVAPAVFNELAFGGGDDKDEDYDALPDYIKDNYYLIKTGDGSFVRIPKGRMLSVFGSAARRTIELAEGEEDAFEGYLSNVNNQIGINNPEENNIFSPLLQAYGSENGTAWYGGDIVPTRLQDKPKGEQYDASTDKMSIWLGEHLGISPYKLNYVLDQYTGGIGDILLPMITDEATSNGSLLAPVVDKFTADSTTDNKYVSDFYTKNDELKVKANSSKATDDDLIKNQYMYSVSKEMSQLYAERRNIQADNSLSKSEKYEKSQAIKQQINRLAKSGLDNYENPTVTSNYASVGDYDYYKNAKGKWTEVSDKDEENINSLGLTNQEKSSYFKTSNDLYNIDQKYKGQTGTEASNNKKVDIINSIKNANLPDTAKAKLYDKKYASTETLNAVIDCGIDFDSYLDLQAQNFTADKNIYGKTINGSKKNKVYNYINNLNMPYEQKIMLAKLEYKSDDTYNREIIDYLNNDNSISYQDMTEILKAMGFKVDEYGNITWE